MQLHLDSFIDELSKIAAFANAMPPPSSQAALQVGRRAVPGPMPVPHINEAAAGGMNYKMHMPTVLADMQQRAANPTVHPGMAAATKTIPAAAGTLPGAARGIVQKAEGALGAAAHATMRAPSSFPASIAKTISAPAMRAMHL
jgi:hypothetical protein